MCQSQLNNDAPVDVPLAGIAAGSGVLGNIPMAAAPALVAAASTDPAFTVGGAGLLATLFLLATAVAGLVVAPNAYKLAPRRASIVCFLIFVLGHGCAIIWPSATTSVTALLVAGAAAGTAAAITSGLIARSPTPEAVASRVGLSAAILLIVFGGASAWASQFGVGGVHSVAALAASLAAPLALTLPVAAYAGEARVGLRRIGFSPLLLLAGIFVYSTKDGIAWSLSQSIAANRGLGTTLQAGLLTGAGVAGIVGAGLAVWCSARASWLAAGAIGLAANMAVGTAQYLVPGDTLFIVVVCLYSGAHIFLVPFLIGMASALDTEGPLAAAAVALMTLGTAIGPIAGSQLLALGGATLVAATIGIATVIAGAMWLVPALHRHRQENAPS